tara:strand:+ start:1063 stop:1335 length:273 start_codon:yes stop_codon:yes gene_type:complete
MLYPLNRYLVVEMCADPEEPVEETTILLPEEAKVNHSPFCKVKILQTHRDSSLQQGMCLIVPTHTVEEATVGNDTYYLVLENNVVGFLGQ